MAKSHLNQAKDALSAVNCELITFGYKGDKHCVVNCPVCGGNKTAWVGREVGAKLASRMVCMAKGCKAQRRAFKVRSEKGRLVLDK